MTLRSVFPILLLGSVVGAGFIACGKESDTAGGGGSGEGGGSAEQGPGPTSTTGGPGSTAGPGSGGSSQGGASHGGAGPGGAGPGGAGPGGAGQGGAGQGGAGTCAHDVCRVGVALDAMCSPCVVMMCDPNNGDPFCCDSEWDDTCVSEVLDACGIDCGGGGGAGGGGTGGAGGGGGGQIQEGDLVITEIMNNPNIVTDANGEWFEVYNATGNDIDMAGLVIRHSPTLTHQIASSVVVPAGGYAVLGINGDTGTNGGINVDYVYAATVSLANTSDTLAIETADAVPLVVDQTSWDEASGLDPDGSSRSLDPNFLTAFDNEDDTNFCAATSFIVGSSGDKGTPGAPNDPCP